MFRSRKTVLLLTVMTAFAILLAGCGSPGSGAQWPAMDSLREIDTDDVIRVDFQRATEGGAYSNSVYDAQTIEDICLRLANVEIKSETDASVDDNGLAITVKTEDKELKFSFEGDILVLEDGSSYEVEELGKLRSYIDGLIEEMESSGDSGAAGSGQGSTGSSGSYDITDNYWSNSDGSVECLYFNDFLMVMPDNDKWSYEVAADRQSVTFYLFSAQQEGYGGKLVTIAAYDLDDSSYEQLPSYHVAGVGRNVNKRFIAEYPTDVQWNASDAQQDADYRDLQAYLQKIGEGAVNSPLQTSDSD